MRTDAPILGHLRARPQMETIVPGFDRVWAKTSKASAASAEKRKIQIANPAVPVQRIRAGVRPELSLSRVASDVARRSIRRAWALRSSD